MRMPMFLGLCFAASAGEGCRKTPQPRVDAGASAPPPIEDAGPAPVAEDAAAKADAALPVTLAIPRAGRGATARSGFERFYAYEAPSYVIAATPAPLPIDLDGLVSSPGLLAGTLASWGLDETARETLARNGFVVLAARDRFAFDDFATMYERLPDDIPIYVTVDTALHLYHLIFDGVLMTLEAKHLSGMLAQTMDALREQAVGALELPGLAGRAAEGNLAVIDVVRSLLDPSVRAHPKVRERVEAEVARILEHAAPDTSPVFGYAEDYTQYVPRGHYARSETLARYFRAMMWIGRMTFLVRAKEDPDPAGIVDIDHARTLAAQSALFVKWLQTAMVGSSMALHVWDRIYRTTAFFAGFSDDLTPVEVAAASERAFGEIWAAGETADVGKVDRLRMEIAQASAPAVYSGTGGDAVRVQPQRAGDPQAAREILAAAAGLRLMGQRYTPDADIMGRLAFPSVGLHTGQGDPFTMVVGRAGRTRGFARGLDVMALLGAPRAAAILAEAGDTAYERYDAEFERARAVFPQPDDPRWRSNLYWAWLEVLREVAAPAAPPTQAFQTSDAWSDRLLAGALASWAALRHDTILYVKQPYVPLGAGPRPTPEPPKGYVDPYPEVFARLRSLGEMTRRGLQEMRLLDGLADVDEVFREFDETLGRLQDIAVTEVENRPLAQADNDYLDGFADRCDSLLRRIASIGTASAGAPEGIPAVDLRTALVADVMTNAEAQEVLEEASGRLDLLVAVVRVPGSTEMFLAAGPVFSYFEFRWPQGDRLTDEAWRGIAHTPSGPPAPRWTCSFRRPCPE